MSEPLRRAPSATYADLEALPSNLVGELLDGELYASPRPAAPHAMASSRLGHLVGGPFDFGTGGPSGPGGWVILDEPELHLGSDVIVPDLAGWRRERMPEIPDVAFFTLAPDWICEILSPSTARIDRLVKLDIYAREGVLHAWLIDPGVRTLEAFELDGGAWKRIAAHADDAKIRVRPFDAIELPLGALWAR